MSTVRISGLRELDAALGALGKSAGKAVLRRVGIKALQPMAADAEARAPRREGQLAASIAVGTKLTRRQARLNKKAEGKSSVEVFMGPNNPAAVPQEFGTIDHGPQPFLRPAYDSGKHKLLDDVKQLLGEEIVKTAKRQAVRRARLK